MSGGGAPSARRHPPGVQHAALTACAQRGVRAAGSKRRLRPLMHSRALCMCKRLSTRGPRGGGFAVCAPAAGACCAGAQPAGIHSTRTTRKQRRSSTSPPTQRAHSLDAGGAPRLRTGCSTRLVMHQPVGTRTTRNQPAPQPQPGAQQHQQQRAVNDAFPQGAPAASLLAHPSPSFAMAPGPHGQHHALQLLAATGAAAGAAGQPGQPVFGADLAAAALFAAQGQPPLGHLGHGINAPGGAHISLGGIKLPLEQLQMQLAAAAAVPAQQQFLRGHDAALPSLASHHGHHQAAAGVNNSALLAMLAHQQLASAGPAPSGPVPQKSGDSSRAGSAYASRHQAAEQRRRTRINERYEQAPAPVVSQLLRTRSCDSSFEPIPLSHARRLESLRKLVPHAERANTAAFLEEVRPAADPTSR